MTAPTEPLIFATISTGDCLLIWSILPPEDVVVMGNINEILCPGDHFGGRSYQEWRDVAIGAGHVNADWLLV